MNERARAQAEGTGSRPAVALALVASAVLPAAATMVAALAGEQDAAPAARLLVTAAVYGPVSALAWVHRRADVAGIAAALAVSSGWMAFLVVLKGALPGDEVLAGVTVGAGRIAGVAELAALSLLGWLVLRTKDRPYRVGIALGMLAPALGAADALFLQLVPSPGPQYAVTAVPLALALISFLAALITAGARWRGGDRRERAAWGWFLTGAVLTAGSYARLVLPLPAPLGALVDAAFVCAQGCLPVAILAIVVTTAPRRSTVAAIATAQSLAFGAAAYLAVTAVGGWMGAEPAVTGIAAAAVMALLFGATAAGLRGHLNTLLLGHAPDAREVLGRLGERLEDDGLSGLATSLRDTWGASSVEIALTGGERIRVGTPAAGAISAPLRSAGRTIGSITLTHDDDRARERIRPVLAQTAGLIAAVVHLAAVNEEVATMRRRTLDVRREERRMLHDELHDSLAPALAGIGYGLSAAGTLLGRDDPRWLPALQRLREDTTTSIATVRRLARTLLPTALDQGDLEGALTELGKTASTEGLRVHLDAHATDVLEVDVQLSLYLLLADVLANARRDPGVRGVEGTVTLAEDVVRVTLRIDGISDEAAARCADLIPQRAEQLGAVAVRVEHDVIAAEFRR